MRAKVDVPIIAAGGICDGISMAAAFALGAEGVQMGTRMVAALESPIHDNWKHAVVAAADWPPPPTTVSIGTVVYSWATVGAAADTELEIQLASVRPDREGGRFEGRLTVVEQGVTAAGGSVPLLRPSAALLEAPARGFDDAGLPLGALEYRVRDRGVEAEVHGGGLKRAGGRRPSKLAICRARRLNGIGERDDHREDTQRDQPGPGVHGMPLAAADVPGCLPSKVLLPRLSYARLHLYCKSFLYVLVTIQIARARPYSRVWHLNVTRRLNCALRTRPALPKAIDFRRASEHRRWTGQGDRGTVA